MTTGPLISAVEDVLQQGRVLLTTVDQQRYARKHEGQDGTASMGAHYRHVLDHFLCLLEGIASGSVNYDLRRRSPELEGSVSAALLLTDSLIERFRNLPLDALERECIVIYTVGYGKSGAHEVSSNVAREIMFCVGHAIHHYAIVKMECYRMSVEVPYEFGIAPSTLKHREAEAAERA